MADKKPGLLKRIFSFGFGRKKTEEIVEEAQKDSDAIAAEQRATEEARRVETAAAEQARQDAEELAQREAAEKARQEAEAAARLEAEEAARVAAQQLAEAERKRAEDQAKKEAEKKRQLEDAERQRLEAERLAAEDAQRKAAAKSAAEEKARREAEEAAAKLKLREEEERARVEAERVAAEKIEQERREAEEQARRKEEAAEEARIEAEEAARLEEAARVAAEEKAAAQRAAEQAKKEAAEKAQREAALASEQAKQEAPEPALRQAQDEAFAPPVDEVVASPDAEDAVVAPSDREGETSGLVQKTAKSDDLIESDTDVDNELLQEEERREGWFKRLRKGLARSSSALTENIAAVFTKRKLDEDTLQELEDILIQADLGVETAMNITDALSDQRYGKDVTEEEVRQIMASEVQKVLEPVAQPLELDLEHQPHVILVVGVNGSGKTTTIGKLSQKLYDAGFSTLLVAGDTFRAAAIEQLKIWGERTQSPVVSRELGSDAAGLAFDAYNQAKAEGRDVLMMDTAGRLQNKTELMAELEKIVRVLKKQDPAAPHTVLLTLDATTGQNAMNQVEIFKNVAGVNGLVMTKLDGTARGGILVSISARHKLPVFFVGVGEQVEDLEPFEAEQFAKSIAGLEDA